MISKIVTGALFALLVSACSDPGVKVSPQDNAAGAQSAEADEADGTFEQANLRAHRTPRRIERFDANKDGMLQKSEIPPRLEAWFTAVDANKDNVVTVDEIRAYNKAHPHPHHQHGQHHQQQQQQGAQPQVQQHASDVTL